VRATAKSACGEESIVNEPLVIVLGVDGSWADDGAVDWALHESKLSAAPVRVVHVVDDRLPLGAIVDRARAVETAKRLVDDVRDYLDRHDNVTLHTGVVLSGAPGHTLAQTTAGDRMVVVGRHSKRALDHLLIGSTAEVVAYEAETAVVVVPRDWSPGEREAPIVVGADEFRRCETAIDFAAGLAAERTAPVRLVHVWDVPRMLTGDEAATASTVETARRHHGERLEKLVRECRDNHPDVHFDTELRRGHPVAGLADVVGEAKAQLLVVGGRTHPRLLAPLLGGTARGVLLNANCPTAIVHAREAD
jgi:nucleotide-binding universal stress UspA family protein